MRGLRVAMNRRRRRGTLWIELSVFAVLLLLWVAFGVFVYRPPIDNAWLGVAWAMIPIFAWQAWVLWFRNHRPDEPEPAAPRAASGPLPDGMVYASDWQEAWLRRQQERRRTRGYVIGWRAVLCVAVAVVLVGVLLGQMPIVVAGVVVASLLAFDRWKYFPHDSRAA
jgi:hypothetical protein